MSTFIPSILLDLDGTLIDSQPGILSSCRAALRVLGHQTDPRMDIESIIGPPIEDVMRYLLKPFGDTRVDEAVEAYRTDYSASGLLMSELYPGIVQGLASIRDRGGRLFLATSKRGSFARRILGNFELSGLFDGIYGSEPGAGIDHKPELIAHILAENRLGSDECLMVGDRRFDISGAHANGMKALGVLWGYGSRQELEDAGADKMIERPEQLADAALSILKAR